MTAGLLKSWISPALFHARRIWLSGDYTREHEEREVDSHLREAANWLCRAQDAGDDRGVSYGTPFRRRFLSSYPETTGYIIPTFLDLASYFGDADFERRALEMARWEVDIQMPCGAVQAGRVSAEPKPAVFNTGQVLLGWAAMYSRCRDPRLLDAGTRAADWLLSLQEPDGRWVKGNSPYADPAATVYNVKAAWGLCEFGVAADNPRYVEAATRNAIYALTRQRDNGWFEDCCLTDRSQPLLHTIAYTMQGLLGIGFLTGRRDFVDAAALTANALLAVMSEDGFLPGRYTAGFRGSVEWCCLTGSAQTSAVWADLAQATGDQRFSRAHRQVNKYLRRRHDLTSANQDVRGGMAGSWPVWGEYGQFMTLNWATKFFVDALLRERALDGAFCSSSLRGNPRRLNEGARRTKGLN